FRGNGSELGDRLIASEGPMDAYEALRPTLRGGETVLLKGSRGVQLERWLPLIERDFAQAQPPTVNQG
ncbi:MAG TPA: hypothetical protein VK689_01820, partial [Armatimonadota bacterium]|nr:hypothetical protein [Armatimonadota bacterium]